MIDAAKKAILVKREGYQAGTPAHRRCSNMVQNLATLDEPIHWPPQEFYIKKNLALNAGAFGNDQ